MANQEHLDLLKQGVTTWNKWRNEHLKDVIDLSKAQLCGLDLSFANFIKAQFANAKLTNVRLNRADLRGADLRGADLFLAKLSLADLRGADFTRLNLSGAELINADLRGADFSLANLSRVDFTGSNLSGANFSGADISQAIMHKAQLVNANLSKANLKMTIATETDFDGADLSEICLECANLGGAKLNNANLSKGDLTFATLVQTELNGAILTGCSIYGISAWDVKLKCAKQWDLVITRSDQPKITVDNLKVAQVIYLLLNNEEIRDVIDTITTKVVLILGRFTEERKKVLNAIRDELRKRNYTPVLFDFEKPANRDLTETVSTLAHLARFIIVDLTDPSSAPHEVATVIPQTVVPVQPLLTLQPLIVEGRAFERHEYTMFEDLRRRYHWVLPTFRYQNTADLLASLQEHIIEPAEQKAKELEKR